MDLLPQLLAFLCFCAPALLWGGCCCDGDCVPPPYKLTNCDNPSDIIYTNDIEDAVIGNVLLLDDDTCRIVSCGSGLTETVVIVGVFASCEACEVIEDCTDCCSVSPTEWT